MRISLRSHRDISGLDTLDTGLGHVGPGLGERPLRVDAAAGVLHHIGLEAGLARVERAPGDAEIRRQAYYKHALDVARLQIGGEPGRGLAVGLGEGRIAVDVLVESL